MEKQKKKNDEQMNWLQKNLGLIVITVGVAFFVFGNALQPLTNTTVDYSTLGVFVFILGIVLVLTRRTRR